VFFAMTISRPSIPSVAATPEKVQRRRRIFDGVDR
jgi:hypothetical protein